MPDSAKSKAPDDLAKLQGSPKSASTWQAAQQSLIAGKHAPALANYRNLVRQYPGVSQLWAEMGIAAAGNLDFTLANQASKRAAELASDASLLISIGQQYHRLRRLEQARACYEQAVAAEPNSVHARLSLAAWLERLRLLDEAWTCVETCLSQHPKDGRALYFRAFLLHRKGQNAEAETALRALLESAPADPDVTLSAMHLLGIVCDKLGQFGEALAWLGKAKAMLRQSPNLAILEGAYAKMDESRRRLLGEMTPHTIQQWRGEAPLNTVSQSLAFLGGPPRSGTTLIEQVLSAHPEILVFDEPEAFSQEVLTPLYPSASARPLTANSLNALPSSTRTQLTGRYFKSLLREIEPPTNEKVFLDKNPSLTASLHIWLRLFPMLKVIITLRDPRDVVLSCYFQNLPLSAGNVNFLTLAGTAKYYADCMDVWLRLRELGGFDWLETRYEDWVADLGREGKRVTNFLGLEWNEAQGRFYEHARRTFVFAPTYSDVTKPVYKGAVNRWEHYAEALAPLEPVLSPYLNSFGYR